MKPSGILMGPYVTGVSETTAKVLWVPRPGAASRCRLSLETAADGDPVSISVRTRDIVVGPEQVHVAALSGLESDHTYRYRLACGDECVEGSFHTALPRAPHKAFRFVIYGDNRSGPERHRRVLEAIQKELPLVFVVNTGDMTANATAWPQWKLEFFDPGPDLWRQTTFWPVRGNHEVDGVLMRTLFDLPGRQCYYSTDVGNLHLVVLDSELVSHDRNEAAHAEMVRWLERDLASCADAWIIAAFHTPIFNIGGDGSRWGRSDVLGVLERGGADIVITSHSHLYERFRPIGPKGKKPIVHIVSGGGGGPEYELRPSPILQTNCAGLHFCVFCIDGNQLEMTVKTPEGQVIDHLRLIKAGGRYQDEVMREALTTDEAMRRAFVEAARVHADFKEVPQPGRPVRAGIGLRDPLPGDAVVSLSPAEGSGWRTDPVEFRAADAPFPISMTAPEGLRVRSGFVEPAPTLHRAVRYQDKAYAGQDVTVELTRASVRLLMPQPEPSSVLAAPTGIVVDGCLDEWTDIPFLTLPATGTPSRAVRLAWSEKGIFGALHVSSERFGGDAGEGWRGGGLQMYLETDFARSFSAIGNLNASKYNLGPDREHGPGRAQVVVAYGPCMHRPDLVEAAWQESDDGYTLEFLVPAAVLEPAKMVAGRVLGFHFVLSNSRRTLEQFVDPEGKPGVWHIPLYWGAVRLV
jgi:hypothetical protein